MVVFFYMLIFCRGDQLQILSHVFIFKRFRSMQPQANELLVNTLVSNQLAVDESQVEREQLHSQVVGRTTSLEVN